MTIEVRILVCFIIVILFTAAGLLMLNERIGDIEDKLNNKDKHL